ncbi:MAG: tRNA preQ1(34) S-adenosylmethionine ribosyltransferase-isomerase QueA [Cyanobacteria bacterium]|nr:tRNA preQ1(34) S-adenosylmethionine ribosyltransferase-isomerase QueA [Cyanobacteriota bacterium]
MSDRDAAVIEDVLLNELAYDLPPELIAHEPAAVRHGSRLLRLDRSANALSHHKFFELPDLLTPGDLIVVNNTRVLPSKIFATRASGRLIEILLLHAKPGEPHIWEAMAHPIRKIKPGEVLQLKVDSDASANISVVDIILDDDGFKRLLLDLGSQDEAYRIMQLAGQAPLPPYIVRARPAEDDEVHVAERQETRARDLERYQTVFARNPGAVAAPTASLHFSPEVIERLHEKGVEICEITLHVGPGTFKPIRSTIEEHTIEAERFAISVETQNKINAAKQEGRRIIACGTTTVRALETANSGGVVSATAGDYSSLFIKPGFKFNVVDALITNFHLSGSSLIVLVAAFAGIEPTRNAYKTAVEERYRFFSYGDAMLIT